MDIYAAVRISLPLALAACGGYMPPTPVDDAGLPPDAQTVPPDAPTDPVDAAPPFDVRQIPFDSGIAPCPTVCDTRVRCANAEYVGHEVLWMCMYGKMQVVPCNPPYVLECSLVCADVSTWCSL